MIEFSACSDCFGLSGFLLIEFGWRGRGGEGRGGEMVLFTGDMLQRCLPCVRMCGSLCSESRC